MKYIHLDHWVVRDNSFSISLMNLHASIKILNQDGTFLFPIVVVDREMNTSVVNFYSLEEAITFVEDVIRTCRSRKAVLEKYHEMLDSGLIGLPDRETSCTSSIPLTVCQVDSAIVQYFSNIDGELSVKRELYVDNNGKPQVRFFIIKYFDSINKEIQTEVTSDDVREALKIYVQNFYNYELKDLSINGGVIKMNDDEDQVYYDGVNAIVINNKKNKQKTRKN